MLKLITIFDYSTRNCK